MNDKNIEYQISKNKINFIVLISIIIVTFVITFASIYFIRQYIIKQAETRIQAVLQEAEALHYYVQREMHPAMYLLKQENRMPKEFYSPEILSSSYITRHVFHQYNSIRKFNQQPLVEYRMASKNPRNKVNQADSLETNLIDLFSKDTTIRKYSGIVELNGVKHLYFARPFLKVEPQCLKCHGNINDAPKELREYYNWTGGFDLKVGALTAIEVIKTPLISEFNTIERIAIVIIIVAGLFIVLIILYSRLSLKNKIIELQKIEIEDNMIKLKNAQNKLVETEKMASLGVLTTGIAHEINNPLNFIYGAYLGFENFFTKTAPEHKEKVAVLFKGMKTGIERATDIVKSLNKFSRTSANNDDCNLHSIIDNCLLMLQHSYKDRVAIEKAYIQQDIVIKGNEGKLHQVFINILTNAIQSVENRGIINIKTLNKNNAVTIIIKDNGCGIAHDNIQKVIEPFFTTKDPGKGTGLGLSIAYTIIKEHNGDIEFESEIKKGTTVKINFPIT